MSKKKRVTGKMYLLVSGQEEAPGSCEFGNEPSGCTEVKLLLN
jgi:hypothetical protein